MPARAGPARLGPARAGSGQPGPGRGGGAQIYCCKICSKSQDLQPRFFSAQAGRRGGGPNLFLQDLQDFARIQSRRGHSVSSEVFCFPLVVLTFGPQYPNMVPNTQNPRAKRAGLLNPLCFCCFRIPNTQKIRRASRAGIRHFL